MELNQKGRKWRTADTEKEKMDDKEVLPSRAEYHGNKSNPKKRRPGKKKRMKVSIPLVLLLILLMLPIIILSIINNGDRSKANLVSSSGEEVSFETEDSVTEADSQTEGQKEKNVEESSVEQESKSEKKEDKSDKKEKESEKKEDKSENKEKKSEMKDNNNKDQEKKEEAVKTQETQAANENSEMEKQAEQGNEEKVTYHTVQQGENLFRIALKYYSSQEGVEKIRQANGLAGNEISVGQTLKIPLP